jgi:hypothetical protein
VSGKKRTPLAFCALCRLPAFARYGFILMLQKNPEDKSVRDEQ